MIEINIYLQFTLIFVYNITKFLKKGFVKKYANLKSLTSTQSLSVLFGN